MKRILEDVSAMKLEDMLNDAEVAVTIGVAKRDRLVTGELIPLRERIRVSLTAALDGLVGVTNTTTWMGVESAKNAADALKPSGPALKYLDSLAAELNTLSNEIDRAKGVIRDVTEEQNVRAQGVFPLRDVNRDAGDGTNPN